MRGLDSSFATVLAVAETARAEGYEVLDDGTTLFGRVPERGPQAWLHILYPALGNEEITDLKNQLGEIPEPYESFLRKTNGLNLFSGALSLFGRRANYSRKGEVRQPYDLALPNLKERFTKNFNAFFFGFYNWDGSRLYIDRSSSEVYWCPRYSTDPLKSWPSFPEMLQSEVLRLSTLFDERGRQVAPEIPTTP